MPDDPGITPADVYRNLSGLTALAVASATPLRHLKDEKDTAFVKRIVSHFIAFEVNAGSATATIPVGDIEEGK